MQTKSSYRVLKWSFVAGLACSLASACVVSGGDGNNDDTDITEGGDGGTNSPTGGTDGGDGGTNTTAGKGGSSGSGGTPSGGTNNTAGTAGSGDAGNGGSGGAFVPGVCMMGEELLTPTVEPSCDDADGDTACITCVKAQACPEYKVCFGEEPSTACSVGATAGADGQFVCITECFATNEDDILDEADLLRDCTDKCNQCDGEINQETTDLVGEAFNLCKDECFPAE